MEERRENNGGEEDARQRRKLPHDVIIHHILPRIPIKSLTQYKVVSKQWYSSLTCPNFTLIHVKKALFSHLGPPIETLFIKSGRSYYLYSCVHDDNVPNHHQTNNLVRFNVKGSDRIFVGSSNGLICSADSYGRYFILWNPITNQTYRYYSLDYSDLINVSSMDVSFSWGMGCVASLNDYKVVRISTNLHIPCCFHDSVHVFSLRSNTWKQIEYDVDDWLLLCSPKLANGTLYWTKTSKLGGRTVCVSFTKTSKLGGRTVCVSFDLAFETFCEFPDFGMSSSNTNKLCVIGGCISKCTCDSQNGLVIEIMNHLGRVVHVGFPPELSQQYPSDLIGFTKTGNIIVAYAWPSRLCLVDLNSTRLLATFENQGRTYIESFVPSHNSPIPLSE